MIDPVAAPKEYQRLLLSYLGDRDPAEVQAETGPGLRSLVAGAGDRLRARPAGTEWSVIEVLGHILDAELVAAARYRWIIAHDEPALVGYDQDLWVDRLGYRSTGRPPEMLAVFDALRGWNLDLWARSTPEERARVGVHAERGSETFDLTFRLVSGHDLFHQEQMRGTLEAVGLP
jgi:DinB superfamily